MTCNHSQEGVYIACVHCDIEHATLAERKRIIKLLKDNAEPMRSAGDGWLPYDDAVDLELAIELIEGEGENK